MPHDVEGQTAERDFGPLSPDLGAMDAELDHRLRDLPSVIVAYSGGVDSAYLAWAATSGARHRGPGVTADSPSYPERHRALAIRIAREFGFRHEIIRTDEMARPEYRANPANRCYYCKHELYTHLTAIARERGIPVDRRRQQRRRPRRLSSRPPGGARIRRAQPARRGRADQGGDPRAVAPGRPADLGRAGLGVPVVAHPVLQRSDRREAADDRAGGKRPARSRVPDLPRAPPRHAGAHRDRPRRNGPRARAGRRRPTSTASCGRSATRTSRSICGAIASAA